MEILLKISDLFGNKCNFVLDKKPTSDTIRFIDNFRKKRLTVFLIIHKEDPSFDFKTTICRGYAYVKDRSLAVHDMSNCLILFVQRPRFASGHRKFKKWFTQTLKTPH